MLNFLIDDTKEVNNGQNILIVGIDPSLASTGIASAILSKDTASLDDVSFTHYGTKADAKKYPHTGDRMRYIADKTLEYLNNHITDDIEYVFVFIEDCIIGHLKSTLPLAQLAGLVKNQIYYNLKSRSVQFVIHEINNKILKGFITGNGSAGKEEMIVETHRKWGRFIKDTNECDAYCLVRLGYFLVNPLTHKYFKDKILKTVTIF